MSVELWTVRGDGDHKPVRQWTVVLEKATDGSLVVKLVESEGGQRFEIARVSRIRGGARLYAAIARTLEWIADRELGSPLDLQALISVPNAIAIVDASIAEEFAVHAERVRRWRLFPETPEGIEKKRQKAQKAREAAIAPFRDAIDDYVLKFSDAPLRYPGGGSFPSHRYWATRYMENHVVLFGELPYGLHNIEVRGGGHGYTGPTHDFRYDEPAQKG